METLSNIESFVRSAEELSFSRAARRLALTPAAVSRNVARLERNLGVLLFQRSTRRLTLTEAGERLLGEIGGTLDGLQNALSNVANDKGEPSGTLRFSMPVTLGLQYVLPWLAEFREAYPAITIDGRLENRPVDLITERLDAAIGGGFPLAGGVVARRLAPLHLVLVSAPDHMAARHTLLEPGELALFGAIGLRLDATGRTSRWTMRNRAGHRREAEMIPSMTFNDPLAVLHAARLGIGVAMLAMPDVLDDLTRGSLVRLLPDWFVDLDQIALYHATQTLLPRKTRALIDFIAVRFRTERLAEQFDAGADR